MVVAEEKSFSSAARKLGLSQPPLSIQIKNLEEEIGVELFTRNTQGVLLTPAGQSFFKSIYPIQGQIQSAIHLARNIENGELGKLRLGFTGTSILNPLVTEAIRQFQKHYPNIELQLKEANSLLLIKQLEDNELDIAVLRPPRFFNKGLSIQLIEEELLVVALSTEYPTTKNTINLGELKEQLFILSPYKISAGLYDATFDACRQYGFEPKLGQQAPQIVSILSLVSANLGIALLPESTQQLKIQGVKYLYLESSLAKVGLSIAHKEGYNSQPAINFSSIIFSLKNKAL